MPESPAPAEAAAAPGGARDSPGAMGHARLSAAPGRTSEAKAEAADVTGVRATKSPRPTAAMAPDAFIANIRQLLAANDREGAARELRRFRRMHADADERMPPELREFAATVPR
jgi:hypothetical protein